MLSLQNFILEFERKKKIGEKKIGEIFLSFFKAKIFFIIFSDELERSQKGIKKKKNLRREEGVKGF